MRLVPSLGLLACVLVMSSCNRRPPVAVTPTSISTLTLQSAHREFAMGDYASAIRDYERYLQLVTSGEDRDQALYHLGVIYAMPEGGRQDWPKAIASLNAERYSARVRVICHLPRKTPRPGSGFTRI